MKNKIITTFFSAALIFLTPINNISAEEEDNFTYTIINNEATIIGFTGEPVFLEIPESLEDCPVTQIRDNAFFCCSSLKQISLPPTIKKIGHHTFYECTSLESVALPAKLENIGMGAFRGCENLTIINIPDTLNTLPESCFEDCSSLSETFIPNGISEIERSCFSGCSSLSYVSIGNSVTTIGSRAFFNCNSMKSLYLPPSVVNIGLESLGYQNSNSGSQHIADFTVLGKNDSSAEKYAVSNSFKFRTAASAVQEPFSTDANIKKIPLWTLLLLAGGGIGLFALSCIIAVKQHKFEKNRDASDKSEKITVDKSNEI